MKLRIRGNSIRLRITRSELARLLSNGMIEEAAQLGMGDAHRLTYALRVEGATVRVEHSVNRITVFVPRGAVDRWTSDGEIGIAGEQNVGQAVPLRILVEKDLACADGPDDADDADAFPNPASCAAPVD